MVKIAEPDVVTNRLLIVCFNQKAINWQPTITSKYT